MDFLIFCNKKICGLFLLHNKLLLRRLFQIFCIISGISQLAAKDGKHLADPEVLRRLTSSVSCALDEAAAALTRMRSDNQQQPRTTTAQQPQQQQQQLPPEKTSLVEACTDGDVGTVRKLLTEGRSVHETSEEGESLLSLACSAGYYELAQVRGFGIVIFLLSVFFCGA